MIWKFLAASMVALLGLGSGYFLGHTHGYKDAYVEYQTGYAEGKSSERDGADILQEQASPATRTRNALERHSNASGRRTGVSDQKLGSD